MPFSWTFFQNLMQHLTYPQLQDVGYYLAFLFGQCVFLLKRASSAIRSKSNPIKNRRAYWSANWDILTVRMACEAVLFVIFKHFGLTTILSWFTTWRLPIQVPQSAFGFACFGYASDSILDWISVSKKCPLWIQKWIKENIPDVQVYESHTVQQGTDKATGAPVTIEKDVKVTTNTPNSIGGN
jgi:hypothetical protein